MREAVNTAIREAVAVPAHIKVAAGACASDLMHGPRFARRPEKGWESLTEDDVSPVASDLDGDVTQVYSGAVGDLLREFISDLPTLYLDEDDFVHTSEPEAYEEDGETIEPGAYSELQAASVTEALFGETISREFR